MLLQHVERGAAWPLRLGHRGGERRVVEHQRADTISRPRSLQLPASSKIGKYMSTTITPITRPISAHQHRLDQARQHVDRARQLLVVERGDALHHLAHVAAALADPQHARGDRRGQSVRSREFASD